jgi:glycosyltransferase involved in cell wall biosynthesis
MKKVAIINPFGDSKGHSYIYAKRICESIKDNVNVTLFTSSDCKIEMDGITIYKVDISNSSTKTKNLKSLSSVISYAKFVIFGTIKTLNAIKKEDKINNYDTIHLIGGEALTNVLYSAIALRAVRKKLILTIHNSDYDYNLYKKQSKVKGIYKLLCKFLFNIILNKTFRKIMVHGDQMKVDLLLQLPSVDEKKVFANNIGIDIKNNGHLSSNSYDNKKIRLLFFGIIRRDKGLDDLVNALEQLKSSNIYLSVVGNPSQIPVDEVMKMAKTNLIKKNIYYDLRYVKEEEIEDIFSAHDFLILPYKKTFQAQSVVLTLAAKYNIPLIASNVGQNGYDVNKYNIGVTFESENVNSLADVIRQIPNYDYHKFKENFKFYLEDNSWGKFGQRMIKGYR